VAARRKKFQRDWPGGKKRRRAAAVQDAGANDERPANAERLGVRQSFRLRGAPKRRYGATAAGAFDGENAVDRIYRRAYRCPMKQTEEKNTFVTCRCQNCDKGIEFDARGFQAGETRTTDCPHCKMETILFVPQSTAGVQSVISSKKTGVILLAISAFFFLLFILALTFFTSDSNFHLILLVVLLGISGSLGLVGAHCLSKNARKNQLKPQPKPKYICPACGSLSFTELVCLECGSGSVIRIETPRGQELLATYHGKVSAKERVEIGDEATRKLLRSLEPIPMSGSITTELEKLAGLVQSGAITHEEWVRAKNLYLGQPQNKREHALARIQQLFDLQQSGAVSESEFNSVKWDILSRGVV